MLWTKKWQISTKAWLPATCKWDSDIQIFALTMGGKNKNKTKTWIDSLYIRNTFCLILISFFFIYLFFFKDGLQCKVENTARKIWIPIFKQTSESILTRRKWCCYSLESYNLIFPLSLFLLFPFSFHKLVLCDSSTIKQ